MPRSVDPAAHARALCASLDECDDDAARELLAIPDAPELWAAVRDALLARRARPWRFGAEEARRLASVLVELPEDDEGARWAGSLLAHVAPWRARAWAPRLLDAWAREAPWARDALRSCWRADVLPSVVERLAKGETWALDALAVTRDGGGPRGLRVERLPETVRHLFAAPEKPKAEEVPSTVEALFAHASESRGREAARAAAQLARMGEPARAALGALTEHADSTVRTIALRGLGRATSADEVLDTAHRMLERERQPDLRRRLIRMLGHRAYAPALGELIAAAVGADARERRAAIDALRAFGEVARRALVRARANARPDRRARYDDALAPFERADE